MTVLKFLASQNVTHGSRTAKTVRLVETHRSAGADVQQP